jgi:hypothetical protein
MKIYLVHDRGIWREGPKVKNTDGHVFHTLIDVKNMFLQMI